MFLAFKDPVIYLIAIFGSRSAAFLCRIIIARILGPRDYGLWNILVLILIYGNFLHLGLLFALVKEISFCRGKEKWREVDEIRNTVFTSIIIISIIASIIIVISSIFFGKHGSYMFVIFCLIGFILILGQIKNYFLCYFIAENNFKAVSASILSLAFVLGSLTTILVIKFRFIGLPLGMALGYPLVLFYIFKKYRPSFGLSINIKRLFSLIKTGFPIMLVVIAYTFFLTIDRVLIFKYIGKENLGFYSIVLFLNSLLILFPISLGTTFRKIWRSRRKQRIKKAYKYAYGYDSLLYVCPGRVNIYIFTNRS
jgi:O-antigen/teichoic acid export membrane protein